jgi:DNA-3-methyladenine glycosylase I
MGESYCDHAASDPWHAPYHEREYGFPVRGDAALLERLALEINQAGLSWLTILKKREAFFRAFGGFEPEVVTRFGPRERRRLLADAGIVRNRLKVDAVIENARRVLEISVTHGSFAGWLDAHHPRSLSRWCALFRQTFRFTGGEIVGEFLKSTGYLRGAHTRRCPVYSKIAKLEPPWMRAKAGKRVGSGRRSRAGGRSPAQGS